MKRRLLLLAAIVAGLVLVVVLTLPWWLGAAARTVGGRYGLQVTGYDNVGYTRWQAREVVWSRDRVTVKVEQIAAGHPLWWLLQPGGRRATAGRWSVVIEEAVEPPESEGGGGWRNTLRILHDVREALDRWLPRAEVGPGEVRWPGGGLQVASAQWAGSELHAQQLAYGEQSANLSLAWREDGGVDLEAAGLNEPWRLDARLTLSGVEGRFAWHEQPGEVRATFAEVGWLPEEAELIASAWRLRGETVRLGDHYSEVSGNLVGTWHSDEGGVLRLQASGVPHRDTAVPPLRVKVDVEGDLQRVTVRALEIFAPGIEAALAEAVTLDPQSQWAVNEALFVLHMNLAELPHDGSMSGQVTGQVRIEPVAQSWPRLQAGLELADVTVAEWSGITATVEAVLEWPRLVVSSTRWRDAMGTRLVAEGSADFSTRQIEHAEVSGQLAAASVARWLPEAISFGTATLAGSAEGRFAEVVHRGTVEAAEVTAQRSHPMTMSLDWSGRGTGADARLTAATTHGRLAINAQVATTGITVSEFQLQHDEDELLRLTQPATLQWSPRWQVEGVRLAGPAGEVAAEVDLVGDGRFAIEAPRVSLAWLADWWQDDVPVQLVRNLQARGVVVREVLQYSVVGDVEAVVANDERVMLAVRLSGDGDGLNVEQVRAIAAGESAIELSGRLPVTLQPRTRPLVRIDPQGEIAVTGHIAPSAEFWQAVAEASGVQVVDPRVVLDLSGQWSRPSGTVRVSAGQIAFTGERWGGRLPEVSSLEVAMRGSGEGLAVEQLSALVEGQQVRARGQLPLTPDEWAQLRQAPIAYLRERGSARFEVPDADLAALARLVPAYLAPAGRARAELQFGPRGRIEGRLRLEGAVSRSLGPLGVLQDIQADLAFAGREMQVRTVEARMGGQPVRLTGTAALTENGPPRLDLKLQGQNLPLVRDTGMLLRADLDLALATDERGDGRATGTVRLRDSLFLAELQDFVPRGGGGGGNRAASRPPYFSVAVEPLNRWRLDVLVEGRDFLRLRTPVLEGIASARFQLTGTLGEPRAIGEATVGQGRVKLPFATFSIQEGEVRLTQADPFQPQVSLTGTSRRLGYDLRMELTGTASEPRLQFFSSPPLPSEDIVLLVMAGQAPQEEVTYTGGQRAVQIGTFLGRGLIGDLFGGDGGDRLSITSGERISRQGRETYRFAYELTPRLSLVGEYDEFDSYNAGVRWRLLPRRGPYDREEDDATSRAN